MGREAEEDANAGAPGQQDGAEKATADAVVKTMGGMCDDGVKAGRVESDGVQCGGELEPTMDMVQGRRKELQRLVDAVYPCDSLMPVVKTAAQAA